MNKRVNKRVRAVFLSQQGFSLAEVLVAFVLFTTSVLGISVMLTSGGANVMRGAMESKASELAAKKIEEVKSLRYYAPYSSEDNDIDDYYYNASYSNAEQFDHPVAIEDYGTISGYEDYKRTTAVQYQYVSGGALTPAVMDPLWKPKNATTPYFDRPKGGPAGGPYDYLHVIVIQVKVYYHHETAPSGSELCYTAQGISGDILVTGGTNQPLLVINSISPVTGALGDTNMQMKIYVTSAGMNDTSQLEVYLWYPGLADYSAKSSPAPQSNAAGTEITCYFDLSSASVRPGYYNIAVYWKDRGVKAKYRDNVFTVIQPPPVITGISNFNWGYRGQNSRQVTITGNYLKNPDSVKLKGPNPGDTYSINGGIVSSTINQIVVKFDLTGDSTTRPPNSKWNVEVTTGGGTDTSSSDSERVWMNPPPNITAVTGSSPPNYYNWAYRSLTTRKVRVEGTYLYGMNDAASSAKLKFGSFSTGNAAFVSGPYGNNCNHTDPIIMNFNPNSAGADSTTNNTQWKVSITNHGGTNESDDVGSERVLMNPPPTLSSLSGFPSPAYTGSRGGSIYNNLTVNGTYIQNNYSGVYLTRNSGSAPVSGTTYVRLTGGSLNDAGTQITGCQAKVYVNPMSDSFDQWSGTTDATNANIGGNYYLYLVNGDSQAGILGTAYPITHATYSISCTATPSGWGSVSGPGTYYQDQSYSLTANPVSSSGNYLGAFRVWQEPPGTDQWSYAYPLTGTATASRSLNCRFCKWFYHGDLGNPGANIATWQQTVNDSPYDNNNYFYDNGGYYVMKIRSKASISFLSANSGEVGARTNAQVDYTGATTLWFYMQQQDGNNNGAANRSYICSSTGTGDRWNVGSLWGSDDVYDFGWRPVSVSGRAAGYIHVNSQTDYSVLGGNSTDTRVRYIFIE
ncbi:MAG: hypothetical protein PHP64_01045 [Actinomycetota bacterium]|nr:hypothetical protein [Actinomycetota bacterium]